MPCVCLVKSLGRVQLLAARCVQLEALNVVQLLSSRRT